MPTPGLTAFDARTEREVEALIARKRFGDARRRLLPLWEDGELRARRRVWLAEKLALCTYKDAELQSEAALETAYGFLKQGGALGEGATPESLCLAGAIHKRLWETAADRRALSRSVAFYTQARNRPKASLDEWTHAAINMAYLHDVLAGEEREAGNEAVAASHAQEATTLRREIVEAAGRPGGDGSWWQQTTLAEALFGLGRYADASAILSDARERLQPDDWQCETAARQLAALARLPPHAAAEEAPRTLEALLSAAAARSLLHGKVGLALSGGGFRAALFHAGALARLAELDMLRHVEVLSCVSGGSIVGALYYLELKRRLETLTDAEMDRSVYIEVVRSVLDALSRAMRGDVRTDALLLSLFSWKPSSKRTETIGGLLDRRLFRYGPKPLLLRDLPVNPRGEEAFHPKRHNWRRWSKVPILVLNTTSLNTGHVWQFTASWMGEPPAAIEPMVDAGERLRRLYHDQAPDGALKAVPLGTAVAASAAVPGLFRPVPLRGLYPGRTVQLSDGGVHDNQGIFSLVEQDCRIMIVSDGSGQLEPQTHPPRMIPGVLQRANNILMEVGRRSAFRQLSLRLRSGRLKEMHFAHLKTGLATADVTWTGGTEDLADAVPRSAVRSGLNQRVQRALAALRTDLDRFSETETLSLMAAGYRIAECTLAHAPSVTADGVDAPSADWVFRGMLERITAEDSPALDPLVAELRRGRERRFFGATLKSWGLLAGGAALLAAAWGAASWLWC